MPLTLLADVVALEWTCRILTFVRLQTEMHRLVKECTSRTQVCLSAVCSIFSPIALIVGMHAKGEKGACQRLGMNSSSETRKTKKEQGPSKERGTGRNGGEEVRLTGDGEYRRCSVSTRQPARQLTARCPKSR